MNIFDKSPNHGGTFKRLQDTTITKEIRQRAAKELNETERNKEMCLRELRILLNGEKNLTADISDEFLLQFLRTRKFNTKKAFTKLKSFYKHRVHYPTVYQKFSLKQNLKALEANLENFLPLRTAEDCAIWVARIGSWDPTALKSDTLFRFAIMCHEKALQNPITQISGIVSIVDLHGFSRTHLLHLPLSIIKCFVSLLLECLPIRQKAIHIINNPSLFEILFAAMKPFLTHKIKNRIHFHGYDMSSLHQHVPPSILPEEFGGTLGPFQNQQFYESLLDSEEHFLENQKYGYKVNDV